MASASDRQMLQVSEHSVPAGKALVSLEKHREFVVTLFGPGL